MGTSTMAGHYVCHILKEDRWVIFNDSKVAYSENRVSVTSISTSIKESEPKTGKPENRKTEKLKLY
jgi:hypothetical protein